jgi:hypothetical protein
MNAAFAEEGESKTLKLNRLQKLIWKFLIDNVRTRIVEILKETVLHIYNLLRNDIHC